LVDENVDTAANEGIEDIMHRQLFAPLFASVCCPLKESLDDHFWSELQLVAQEDVRSSRSTTSCTASWSPAGSRQSRSLAPDRAAARTEFEAVATALEAGSTRP
jgi:hypothetical protein